MKLQFDPHRYQYPSRRNVVYGKRGMVATSNPLAAQVGLHILKSGGNAVDAAIATAAALTVTEPSSNGIGGDAFVQVWCGGKLYGLNASGPAPCAISAEAVESLGYSEIPKEGVIPVTVPGVPAAWAALSQRFGRLPLTEALEPAADYAENGFVLQPCVGTAWEQAYQRYSRTRDRHPEVQSWFDTFAPEGKCLCAGDTLVLRDHASTLRELAATGCESFYRGALAHEICSFLQKHGGFLRADDLANYRVQWVEPLSTEYKGYDVYELPPNGQGITVLMALNILKGIHLGPKDSFQSAHGQIEALKMAFCDVQKYVADPNAMRTDIRYLLSEEYAQKRRSLITDTAHIPAPIGASSGGTVYLCAADEEGNMVSYIQSNYMGFGSGVVVPDTGIALHNRGGNFTLDRASDNVIAPGKRPYHTIIPGFLAKDGKAVGPFGVMGGFVQPQGHLQVILDTVQYGMNPQEALDCPRWNWTGATTVEVEQCFDNALANQLLRAGHDIRVKADSSAFGRGEIIWRDDSGILCGACEPRTDGMVAVW